MRISDWSSDVCSSDLVVLVAPLLARHGLCSLSPRCAHRCPLGHAYDATYSAPPSGRGACTASGRTNVTASRADTPSAVDRKSVVQGKSVSVRVDHGGGRIINIKNQLHYIMHKN